MAAPRSRWARRAWIGALLAAGAGLIGVLTPAVAGAQTTSTTSTLPPIKHVWLIDLENEGYDQTVGNPAAPYLGHTLPSEGALLENYFAVGHDSADNYIAQISGQAPNIQTEDDCGRWNPFPKNAFVLQPYSQLVGKGCVFPSSIPTVGNQLSDAGFTWTAYLQDMGNIPSRDHTVSTPEGPACGHPAVGALDDTEGAVPGDQYASRHEGFMYFQSVTGNASYCDQHVLSFQPLLGDLASVNTTPNFSFIAPNLCNDGHDSPCVTGDPGGLPEINAFLSIWIPEIMKSPAYKENGLIVITFDEGSTDAACCGELKGFTPSHPDSALPGMGGPGGGRVETVLLSKFIKPGTTSTIAYNHYSLLKTIEDIFGLGHIGDAQQPQVHAFGSDVFTG